MENKKKVIWLTGLSGSGKSTISEALLIELKKNGNSVYVLDGDVLRKGLNSNLGFSNNDRLENVRRTAELAKILLDLVDIVIVALITPYDEMRKLAKIIIGVETFKLVYIYAPLEVCEMRDVKGFYKLARNGFIKNFTGIDSIFQEPEFYNLKLDTSKMSLEECIVKLIQNQ